MKKLFLIGLMILLFTVVRAMVREQPEPKFIPAVQTEFVQAQPAEILAPAMSTPYTVAPRHGDVEESLFSVYPISCSPPLQSFLPVLAYAPEAKRSDYICSDFRQGSTRLDIGETLARDRVISRHV